MENKENIDIFEEFPIKDEANLQLIDTKLKNDTRYRNEMIKQLSRLTRDDLKATCIGLMRAIISNELAVNYSWFGAKKKQIFSQLEICKVILSVIRKSHIDATDEKISAPIKVWLAHAKERLGRRAENVVENIAQNVVENVAENIAEN
ncbi:PREDICTED: uncharacterized protein LOC105454941 [Wasmannia auropunctata]|uniref:uncharacterized protein LOC105454941 n=1 Tax=Wasmannia auropunctata TaxID=64793 RepID=UPI0005EDF4D9|nr:PREDICTED: uncharacterized protein LOC105454941 [Wasmannia auropunctata]